MGFSGGGSNVLKNHKHDATVVQDGGSLDADNVTSADLTAGDVIFSDGTHLQRLAIGTPAQQIQVNAGATAPEYFTPVAAGSNYEFLGSSTITSGSPLTLTLSSAVANPDYVVATFAGQPASGQAVDYQVNGLTANYNNQGTYFLGGGNNNINQTGATFFQGISSSTTGSGNDAVLYFKVFTNPLSGTIFTQSESYTSSNGYTIYGGFNSTAAQTEITSLTCLGNAFSGTLSAWAVRN